MRTATKAFQKIMLSYSPFPSEVVQDPAVAIKTFAFFIGEPQELWTNTEISFNALADGIKILNKLTVVLFSGIILFDRTQE